MSASDQVRILRRLDDPWKLALWELDVALPFALCLFFGLLKGTATGLGLSVLVGWFITNRISRIKSRGHPRYFRHLIYWIFPPEIALTPKALPPSAQHEMVG